jgi:hypothetical protein
MPTKTRRHKNHVAGKFQVVLRSNSGSSSRHNNMPSSSIIIPSLILANPEGDNSIELRLTHQQSSIMQVTHNGKIYIQSTINAAETVFETLDAPSFKSSYNNTSSNANGLHVLLRLPQNMKL